VTELANLVRTELRALTEAEAPPGDLAERALAGQRRRRTRRLIVVGAAAVVVAAAAATTVALPTRPTRPAAEPGPNVVYASTDGKGARILDAKTGRYRTVEVDAVTAPSADLRYAIVLRTRTDGRSVDVDRIGRYESTTGAIRWYDMPVPVSTARGEAGISPDGRYAAILTATAVTSGDFALVIVDLNGGTSRLVRATRPAAGEAQLQWQSDSRHVILGNQIIDLDGHTTATLPVPDGQDLVAARPDGTALLVAPAAGRPIGPRFAFGLADPHGTLMHTVPTACGQPRPSGWPAAPGNHCSGYSFVAWRSAEQILLFAKELADTHTVVELDLRTGASRLLHLPVEDASRSYPVVATVVHRSDVVASATF